MLENLDSDAPRRNREPRLWLVHADAASVARVEFAQDGVEMEQFILLGGRMERCAAHHTHQVSLLHKTNIAGSDRGAENVPNKTFWTPPISITPASNE
jgi:hypothetical protein